MFLFKVPAGTVSYLDIFVLVYGWFANNLIIHTILLSLSLTSLHGVNTY